MPNDVHWLLQMTALGVQLKTAFSHINSFHATDNAVELMDCSNSFIANSTHALSLRTGSQQLGSSIPLGKGLSQVIKQLSRPRSSVLRELGLLNLIRHCQAQLKLSNISLILQSQPRTQCLQKLMPCLNLFHAILTHVLVGNHQKRRKILLSTIAWNKTRTRRRRRDVGRSHNTCRVTERIQRS